MTKALGFSIILLAALLFSLQRIEDQKRLAAAVRSFGDMLEQMMGLLEIQAPPMPELLNALSHCSDGAAAMFVERLSCSMENLGAETFHTLWQKSLYESGGGVDKDALQTLDSLGNILGRYDLKTQLDAIASCLHILRQRQEKLQQSLPQSKRLVFGVTLSAAMLLGIILI